MEKELSDLEKLKASRNPLRVVDDMFKEANEGIPLKDEYIGLLKWYGMYPHINHDGREDKKYFMKRIKLTDTKMNLEQLEVMAKIGLDYAQGLVDFTDRQNVQFHYIEMKDIPAIFELLESVGLTSRMASGDGPRPIMTSPVGGIDPEEIIDASVIAKQVDTYFDENEDRFCNFPRKYKIGISGCSKHAVAHEIQDVAFTAFKDENGEVLFDLTLAGGLSKSKQIAYRANRYVKPEQVLDVAVVCAEIFRDNGNRHNRNKARVRHLVNEWGLEKFVDAIEEKLGYKLQEGTVEPAITPFNERDHFGIHKAKQEGESFIGFATNSGRVAGVDFKAMSDICKKYNAGGIALTSTQNFIVYGVKDEVAQALADEFDALGYPYKPTPFRARLQSCTGIEFCKFGITETKEFAKKVVVELEQKNPEFNEPLMIAISGCGNGCSQPQIADIGFVGTKVRDEEGNRVEGYDVLLGGHLQGEKLSRIAKKTGVKVQATKLVDFVTDLITEYNIDNLGQNSFKDYLNTVELSK
ncbi:sulfite reductase [Malaciobacter pacificus]|uniref:Ferredoxin-nitrite reductase n=1 Tax=Malaciobacter pacificus TaxID=1080223 RepID=A0A5C2H8G9_9BACT|nr:nitrite/sulfite reductase [Malaciobacter pacificus]QEP35261.1 ferredoxin-nitrite reductase [Malaciobacter pacificus]GGD42343.1 sulfite reductase [Malaciobacter pacificus]